MCEPPVALKVVRAGARWVVVDKPPGLLAVPGRGADKQDCVAARVAAAFPGASGPLVVHRLDMATSGLMLLALDAQAQRALSMQFEARATLKGYVALVAGAVAGEGGLVDLPLRPDLERRPLQIHDPVHGRPAQTRWRVLAHEARATRLGLEPLTGRTHQLRLHCALGLGAPILGDPLYGDPASAPRLMLDACRLGFSDPESGAPVLVERPPPF